MRKKYNEGNIFHQIISGKLVTDKIYEDDDFICIKDINPVAPIHLLMIPKAKFLDFEDFISNASSEIIINYYNNISKVIKMQNIDQYRIITNQGAMAGQTVFHFHTHIIGGKILGGLIGA